MQRRRHWIRSTLTSASIVAGMLVPGVLGMNSLSAQERSDRATLDTETCFIPGIKTKAQCARLDVPLYHDRPEAGSIEIFAAILPAKSGKPEPDPLLLFAGGPGQSASELAVIAKAYLGDIWQDRDIVLIDQRGTGQSTPLDCDSFENVYTEEEVRQATTACLNKQTVDTRAFNLEESVHDFAAVIKALGYQQVNTYGVSYGTRTSAHFYRRYPELVRSIMIDAIAPPDYPLFDIAPKAADDALTALFDDCAASTACNTRFPNLRDDLNTFIGKARAGDLRYVGANPVTGEALDVPLGEVAAVESIRSVLYGVNGTTFLPYAIERAAAGDLSVIFNQNFAAPGRGRMYLGMTLSFLCGEDIDRTDPDAAARAGEGTFTRDTFYRNFVNLCSVWEYTPNSMLPQDMFAPWRGDVPVLALSGALDPVTPKEGGDHVVATLENARHIVVPGTGHGTMSVSCIPFLMTEFVETLDGASLDARCTERMKRPPILVGPNGQTIPQ